MMRVAIAWIAALLTIAGCGDESAGSGSAKAKSPEPSALVTVTPAKLATISRTLTAYGTVEYAPEGLTVLSVPAEEVVSRLGVAVGQEVRRGEGLLTLEPSSAARLQLEQAKITVAFAGKEVDRLTDLRTRELAINSQVQAAEQTLASNKAALANLEQRHFSGTPHVVRASVSGVVQTVNVQVGQVVAPGAPLLSIGNADRTRVRLGVEQDALPQIAVGQRVAVSPLNSQNAPIASRVSKIYRNVDRRTRLTEVVIPLPPRHGLLPGAYVQAQITLAEHPQALVVPRPSVLYGQDAQGRQDKPYVYVDASGHASKREVTTGIDNGTVIEITQGLSAGQDVVSDGNAQLKDGMALRTEPPR